MLIQDYFHVTTNHWDLVPAAEEEGEARDGKADRCGGTGLVMLVWCSRSSSIAASGRVRMGRDREREGV
jgi:hypothetical protein